MPLYFIDLYDGETAFRDEYGIALGSLDEAADQAAALLPDMMRDVPPGRDARDFAAFVRDENAAVVYRAALLFRGQRPGMHDLRTATRPPEADDIVLRSRETRAAAREVAIRLQEHVQELLTLIETACHTARSIAIERQTRR